MTKDQIIKLKDKVAYCLELEPLTRNDDKILTWKLWHEFYGIGATITAGQFTKLLPSQAEIQRLRAVIQNDEKRFLPTSWEVAKGRGWQESEWRAALGYEIDLFGMPRIVNVNCPANTYYILSKKTAAKYVGKKEGSL